MEDRKKKIERIIGKLGQEPQLQNADELTSRIMDSIENVEQTSNKRKYLITLHRTLAAASVIIMFVFGVEQYIILQKVSKLEKIVANTKPTSTNGSIANIIDYNIGTHSFNKELSWLENNNQQPVSRLKTKIVIARLTAVASLKLGKQRTNMLTLN